VYETWPILQASKSLPNWVRTARDDYVKSKNTKKSHIYRCPGIADIYKQGFVVHSWHDITVTADKQNMNVELPSDELPKPPFSLDIHRADGVAKHIPKRHYSCDSVLKINTPWHVISPVKLLVIPFPYADQSDFEACSGILDPSISTEVNIQVYWNRPGQQTLIKAGTPLCLMIPLTEDECSLEIREATDFDQKWLKKKHYLNNMGYVKAWNKMKSLYEKVWNYKIK